MNFITGVCYYQNIHVHQVTLLTYSIELENNLLEGANNSIITLYLSIYERTFISSTLLLLLSTQGGLVMLVLQ